MSGQALFFLGFLGIYLLSGILAAYANRQIRKGKKGW